MLISVLCNLFTLLHVIIKQEEGNAPESKPASSNIPVITCKPSHTFMVKYYGALPVADSGHRNRDSGGSS